MRINNRKACNVACTVTHLVRTHADCCPIEGLKQSTYPTETKATAQKNKPYHTFLSVTVQSQDCNTLQGFSNVSSLFKQKYSRRTGETGLGCIHISSLPLTQRPHCLYRCFDSVSFFHSAPFSCSSVCSNNLPDLLGVLL